MAIEVNPTTLGRPVTKPHYDVLYRSALLADSGGAVGGAQTVPGDKTFSGITTLTGGKRVGVLATSTSPVTITDTDGIEFLLVTTGVSAFTVNLPTAADNTGRIITVRKVDSGAGKITVDGEGAETIDGNTTAGIWYVNNFLTLLCDGAGWVIIGAPMPILIPEGSRPAAWVLPAGAATTFTDVDFGPYTPKGVKGLCLKYAVVWVGDDVADLSQWELRQNGATTTDDDQHERIGVQYTNMANTITFQVWGEITMLCDSDGVIEYRYLYGAAAIGSLYLNIKGYYMGG